MMDNFITQELKDEILLNNQLITTVERDISKPGKKSTQITLAKQQLEAARAALDMAMNTVDERASLFLVEKEPCPAPATSDKMKFCEIARKMIPLVDIIASEESSDGVKEAAQARLKEMSDEMVDYFYPPWGVSELFSPKPTPNFEPVVDTDPTEEAQMPATVPQYAPRKMLEFEDLIQSSSASKNEDS